MTLEILLCIAALWFLCGFAGWFHIIRLTKFESGFDAFMVGPCMMAGPIILVIALRSFCKR